MTRAPDDRATEVRNNEAASRYELLLDGEVVGFADYRPIDDGSRLAFPHTEIVEALRGQGLGDRLIGAALDDVRTTGRMVVPRCRAVADFVDRHPEYADLVAP